MTVVQGLKGAQVDRCNGRRPGPTKLGLTEGKETAVRT